MDAAEVLLKLATLPPGALVRAQAVLEGRTSRRHYFDGTDARLAMWVKHYVKRFSLADANRAMGYTGKAHLIRRPVVQAMVVRATNELNEKCELDAKYVRDYIRDILEFCPGDWCNPAPDGSWVISQQAYSSLPQNVKRMIEGFEVYSDGTFKVNFMSKTAALALAAKLTVVQQASSPDRLQIPWDDISRHATLDAERAIDERIAAELALDPVNGRVHQ